MPALSQLRRLAVNIGGAVGAGWFAVASVRSVVVTPSPIGVLLVVEQTLFVGLFLFRRPARHVSRRSWDWLLAFGGTFAGLGLRPIGVHAAWSVGADLALQVSGLAISITSLLALGRAFGFVAADRGLVRRGPYAVVRHPIYLGYFLVQLGFLLANAAVWNVLVVVLSTGCNAGRAFAEEQVLAESAEYGDYRRQVRFRFFPYIW